jgi:hypothetical protein
MKKEQSEEFYDEAELSDEELIEITDEDLSSLSAFGEDPTWQVPITRRIPNPKYEDGGKEKPVLAYRYYVPLKMLTQAELLRMQEGQRIPKGSRNILDAVSIKRWSKGEVDMFNTAIKRAGGKIKFVNVPRGQANYAAGELSIEDLSRNDVRRLEAAISPGMNKSDEDIQIDARPGRRQAGAAPPKPRRMSVDSGGAVTDSPANQG